MRVLHQGDDARILVCNRRQIFESFQPVGRVAVFGGRDVLVNALQLSIFWTAIAMPPIIGNQLVEYCVFRNLLVTTVQRCLDLDPLRIDLIAVGRP